MTIEYRLKRLESELTNVNATKELPANPIDFARSIGLIPDEWQEKLLNQLAESTKENKPMRALCNTSRQSGKSTIVALCVVFTILSRPNSTVAILSPTQRQSSITFRRCLQIWRASGKIVPEAAQSALQLKLQNGSWLVALPSNEEGVRGLTCNLLAIDEAARVSRDLYIACLPFLSTIHDSKLLIMSTPAGAGTNWFYEEWTKGVNWTRYTVTADEVSRIKKADLEDFRSKLPEAKFQQEFYCKFLDSDSAVFDSNVIKRQIRDYPTLDSLIDNAIDGAEFGEEAEESEDSELFVDELNIFSDSNSN